MTVVGRLVLFLPLQKIPLLETEAPNGSHKADCEYRPVTGVYYVHHSRLVIVVIVPGLAENNLARTLNRKQPANHC
jgi:hypothetical protein